MLIAVSAGAAGAFATVNVRVASSFAGVATAVALVPPHAGVLLGSWCASDPTVDVDSKWGGGKSFFSGEGLILLRCTGPGDLLLASYGAIVAAELADGETMTLDTGHVVAFDESVQYSMREAGSWKSTLLGGEGLVTDFRGPGQVWLQTRSSNDLGLVDPAGQPPAPELLTPDPHRPAERPSGAPR